MIVEFAQTVVMTQPKIKTKELSKVYKKAQKLAICDQVAKQNAVSALVTKGKG